MQMRVHALALVGVLVAEAYAREQCPDAGEGLLKPAMLGVRGRPIDKLEQVERALEVTVAAGGEVVLRQGVYRERLGVDMLAVVENVSSCVEHPVDTAVAFVDEAPTQDKRCAGSRHEGTVLAR